MGVLPHIWGKDLIDNITNRRGMVEHPCIFCCDTCIVQNVRDNETV